MRVLITGVNGFVGPYLAEHILSVQSDTDLYGQSWGGSGREALRGLGSDLQVIDADLTDPASLAALVRASRPEVVFHLAAASSVASSWSDPGMAFQVNAIGQINLFEALRGAGLAPVTVVASSAEVYGRGLGDESALSENAPVRPISPYGTSKAAQEIIASQYFEAHGLPTVRLRLFNHTGPRQLDDFVASSFARQIAEIERGLVPPVVEVGHLDAIRDFTDVRDITRAYWLAATRGEPGAVYNVCSGVSTSIGELLETLVGLSERAVEVRPASERQRATEIPCLVGSRSLFTETTSWVPEMPLHRSLGDLLDWWREHV